LSMAFRESERLDERDAAAFALAAYLDSVPPLVELLGAGEASQNAVLIDKLRALDGPDSGRLEAKLGSALESASLPREPATQDITRRTANYALALLALERAESVWPLFRHGEDDSLRTDLINRAADAGVAAATLARRASDDVDSSIRLALLLALGDYPLSRHSHVDRDRLKPWLRKLYATDPDPGIHSAAWWLLMRWGDQEQIARADASLATSGPIEARRWYLSLKGHTLAVVAGPVEFVMGSKEVYPDRNNETLHRVRIGRTFAIATLETTYAQYIRSDPSARPASDSPQGPDAPIDNRSYVDCVAYCRWLTAQEGMTDESQMCYPPLETFVRDGMRPYPDYLERPGYRLPTEAEWEFACRAGSSTLRPFSRFEDHISRYAWWLPDGGTASHPVGLKKPNDLGLFDMLGNLSEWCSDGYRHYETTMADPIVEDGGHLGDDPQRVVRGGAYFSTLRALRSATRTPGHGGEAVPFIGFRVARTLPALADR
jgi:eukaryotic-like serine/threonine-protein kinase